MPRHYKPWEEKHKSPRGFGSHCPRLPNGSAQQMLDLAVRNPKSQSSALYYSDGDTVFVAHEHSTDEFHGYPVAGREAPPAALRVLRDTGLINQAQYSRLLKQAAVPGTE